MTNILTPASVSTPRSKPTAPMDYCREGEGKELDSPMTVETDVSSSFGEHSIMTPTLMNSRLGRIIVSSTEDTRDYADKIGNDVSPTSFLRRRNMRHSINRSHIEEETDDLTETLVSALHQLQRLATLDSTEYQQRLLENNLPALEIQQTSPLHYPSLAMNPTSTHISELSQSIQTPLVQLSMSIHRLHSTVVNITQEVDGHSDEVRELQSQLEVLQRRNKKVERAAKKFHKKNLRLRQEAQRDRKMALELKHKVRQYEAQLESQGFQLMANKVQNHEIQLQFSKTTQQTSEAKQHEDDNSHKPRERINSNMSDFLDIEQESLDDDYSECIKTTESDLTGEHDLSNAESRCTRSNSSVSIHSDLSEKTGENKKANTDLAVSPSSYEFSPESKSLFDNTLPTLRYSAQGSLIEDRKISRRNTDEGLSNIATSSGLEGFDSRAANEPNSPKKTQPRVEENDITKTPKKPDTLSNRFAKFLGAKAQTYNLKIIGPCNIQFAELPLHSANPLERTNSHGASKSSAFAVCGFNGFDDNANMKPTIGARLTKINGKAIDEKRTLEDLYNELNNKDVSTKNRSRQTTLTFRNETWDTAQNSYLNLAIQRLEKQGASVVSDSDIGEKESGGASPFERHLPETQRSNENQKCSDGEKSNITLQRVRTASTDSVGKAFSGIGNFLHNLNQADCPS